MVLKNQTLKKKNNLLEIKCLNYNFDYNECASGCKNDIACLTQCVATLEDANDYCPCQKYCESIIFMTV